VAKCLPVFVPRRESFPVGDCDVQPRFCPGRRVGMILIFRFGTPVVALALPLHHKTLLHVLQRIIAPA
jgi:hypothetical protein